MPNRILREGILESERIHRISPMAELFYRRLMSIADDYGRYACDVPVLLSRCYPRRPTWADEETVSLWIEECREVGLILVYEVQNRKYLEICDFRQQLRAKDSKCPAPAQQMLSRCVADAIPMRSEAESNAETESETTTYAVRKIPQIADTPEPEGNGPIETIQVWLSQYVGHFGKDWGLPDQGVCFSVFRAMNGASLDDLELVLRDLYKRKQSPGKNYAWFVPVVAARFEAKNGA